MPPLRLLWAQLCPPQACCPHSLSRYAVDRVMCWHVRLLFGVQVWVGSQAVRGVSHSLHSPLMSITNAISGAAYSPCFSRYTGSKSVQLHRPAVILSCEHLKVGCISAPHEQPQFVHCGGMCLSEKHSARVVRPVVHWVSDVCSGRAGMTIVGGMLQLGGGVLPHTLPQALATGAVALSAVNLAGGFIVTHKVSPCPTCTQQPLPCHCIR